MVARKLEMKGDYRVKLMVLMQRKLDERMMNINYSKREIQRVNHRLGSLGRSVDLECRCNRKNEVFKTKTKPSLMANNSELPLEKKRKEFSRFHVEVKPKSELQTNTTTKLKRKLIF
mmetsp:Transcript_11244/g.20319  ORF Transcript_11244/g.20319 Transcript_11244/m.20319 type:complete len:117 (+) Transcript_11244:63-413(+)